ncbi:MAG: hypothetical protein KJ645_06385, partial [Planctomycetes bacterium]|nr:hypothetical protein [Planctomycetota bacterium]
MRLLMPFSFKQICLAAGLLTALFSGGCNEQPEPREQEKGPNIIFISVDTLRADHLGCYGYLRDTSPRV